MNVLTRGLQRVFPLDPDIEAIKRGMITTGIGLEDPRLADWLGVGGGGNHSGEVVTERSALSFPAVFRAVALISALAAACPLRTYELRGDLRERVPSVLDNPGRIVRLRPFVWKRLLFVHKLLHGNAYLRRVTAPDGRLLGLEPLHPLAVTPELDPRGQKMFTVAMKDGTVQLHDEQSIVHDIGMGVDGIVGLSPITIQANAIGASLGANKAAARLFKSGALHSGMVSSKDSTVNEADGELIIKDVRNRTTGADRAGDIVFINRALEFTPWTMSARDAQLIEARMMQVEEVARAYGLPLHVLSVAGAQSNWSGALVEQNRAIGRYSVMPYTTETQEALTDVLRGERWAEFEMAGLYTGDPSEEIRLLIEQVNSGLMTLNEAREVRNMPPVEGGDTPRAVPGSQSVNEGNAEGEGE